MIFCDKKTNNFIMSPKKLFFSVSSESFLMELIQESDLLPQTPMISSSSSSNDFLPKLRGMPNPIPPFQEVLLRRRNGNQSFEEVQEPVPNPSLPFHEVIELLRIQSFEKVRGVPPTAAAAAAATAPAAPAFYYCYYT
jgi:hypothetical protein